MNVFASSSGYRFRLLRKMGWQQDKGCGARGQGMKEPIRLLASYSVGGWVTGAGSSRIVVGRKHVWLCRPSVSGKKRSTWSKRLPQRKYLFDWPAFLRAVLPGAQKAAGGGDFDGNCGGGRQAVPSPWLPSRVHPSPARRQEEQRQLAIAEDVHSVLAKFECKLCKAWFLFPRAPLLDLP